MSELSCRQVVEQLWEYIDAELTPEREALIREHLRVCEKCYPHYDFQKAFVEFIRRNGAQTTPPHLRHQIFQSILEDDARS